MIAIDKAIEFAKRQSRKIVESGEEHRAIMLALIPEGGAVIDLVEINKNTFETSRGFMW